ncbi:MATE family efflux transporter [Rheinheimera pacifica]|uniref:MATE family efflux transporter n=1 Tax=Rheinheimera pacifica TaxID=173990 RepID=UPI000B89B76F
MLTVSSLSELRKAVSTAIIPGIVVSAITATLTFLLIEQIASLYTGNPEVIALASSLLLLACIYQITDSVQVICASILRGMKITKPTFFITFIAYWSVGFGLGYVLGLTDYIVPAMGVHGFWIGIIVGLTVAALMLSYCVEKEFNKVTC